MVALLAEKPREVAEEHFLIKIESGDNSPLPGQFINIKPSRGMDPLLRRPFSVFDYGNGVIHVVVRVIGKGTALISSAENEIDFIGPLGKGFTLVKNRRVLLAGGGVGNAPLYFLARHLAGSGNDVTILYGARSSRFIYLRHEYEMICNRLIVTTDDGSEGLAGFVSDAAENLLNKEQFDMIYACGPAPMMRKMVELARNIPVEVSVENYFGCGFGVCSGCTIETVSGLKRACLDGPVFDGKSLLWDTVT